MAAQQPHRRESAPQHRTEQKQLAVWTRCEPILWQPFRTGNKNFGAVNARAKPTTRVLSRHWKQIGCECFCEIQSSLRLWNRRQNPGKRVCRHAIAPGESCGKRYRQRPQNHRFQGQFLVFQPQSGIPIAACFIPSHRGIRGCGQSRTGSIRFYRQPQRRCSSPRANDQWRIVLPIHFPGTANLQWDKQTKPHTHQCLLHALQRPVGVNGCGERCRNAAAQKRGREFPSRFGIRRSIRVMGKRLSGGQSQPL